MIYENTKDQKTYNLDTEKRVVNENKKPQDPLKVVKQKR